jgi:Ca2+-binding EF-hand superfamily protein
MRGAPIPILVIAVTVGIAALSPATPRQDDDQQTIAAPESGASASSIVALGVRRVAIADPDQDGIVSATEAKRYYEARFALMDRDRDGRLSEPEFFRVGTSRSLQAADSFSGTWPLSFEAAHVDGSAALTPEAFLRVARRAWAIGADREAGRQSIFAAADANGDGALSGQELMVAGSRHFARSDANRDGRVTIWEFYGGTRS